MYIFSKLYVHSCIIPITGNEALANELVSQSAKLFEHIGPMMGRLGNAYKNLGSLLSSDAGS